MADKFTLRDAGAISPILEAAIGNKRVRRLVDERIIEGTARSVGDDRGNHARRDEDVRDLYLRVTTVHGWEAFWPVAELMRDVEQGLFAVD